MKMLERFWFGCGHCHSGEGCPFAAEAESGSATPATGEAGLPIPISAGAVFLIPLAGAILGAYVCGELSAAGAATLSVWQFAGGAAGFVAGAVLAKLALAGICRLRALGTRGKE
ncbi:MAG TPA: hypothetical protein PLP66_08065 [Phycisphaerae bacterium]|nr:hypothetical protein [Phycisphaerae bacterium]HPM23848.1 hypothetical protein [Phycisphaerae bacterium]